jgi:hypothetical protein
MCRGANKEEPYPYRISGIRGLEKEESRVFDSRTRELRKVLALRPGCGRMEM